MVVTPENIFPLAAADGVSACTGLHNIVREEEGGGVGQRISHNGSKT